MTSPQTPRPSSIVAALAFLVLSGGTFMILAAMDSSEQSEKVRSETAAQAAVAAARPPGVSTAEKAVATGDPAAITSEQDATLPRKPVSMPATTTPVRPAPTPLPSPPVIHGVRMGDACAEKGTHGLTDDNEAVICTATPADKQLRWRRP